MYGGDGVVGGNMSWRDSGVIMVLGGLVLIYGGPMHASCRKAIEFWISYQETRIPLPNVSLLSSDVS